MLFPALILLGGLFAIHSIVKSRSASPEPAGTAIGAVSQTQRPPRPCLTRLLSLLRQGREPTPWIVDEAIAEAYDLGDWQTLAKIRYRFRESIEVIESEGDENDGDQPEEGGERENNDPPDGKSVDAVEPSEQVMIGRTSPFDDVPDESWDRFVASLETQAPSYQGPKHVGRFHHSRERLAQLAIDDVSTPDKQYDALVTDLLDVREKAGALIREFECQMISINGDEKIVTLSGILAVIKSAGLEHARSWFVSDDDRTKFPKTTEMFSRANGAF